MSKQFKVGLIALVSGVILYWGFNFLKGTDFLSPTQKYYVVYDNVDGLTKSNPVIINGLSVGRVNKITLLQETNNDILVELDIDKNIIIGKGTTAALSSTDILGSKGIILTMGDINQPLESGDTLKPKVDEGLNQLIESAKPVANNINTTITRVNEILIDLKGIGQKINGTMSNVEEITAKTSSLMGQSDEIAQNQKSISEIISSTAILIENLNQKINQMDPILAKSEGVLDSLNNINIGQTVAGVDTLLYNLNATILQFKNSEGTLGKLINDDSVYTNLNQTLVDLNKLLVHINNYPKDFFGPLGRKHKKLEGLEED